MPGMPAMLPAPAAPARGGVGFASSTGAGRPHAGLIANAIIASNIQALRVEQVIT
jgi:hypothetical protein